MVGGVGYRDSKGGAKAHAVFCSLDADPVVTFIFGPSVAFGLPIVSQVEIRAICPLGIRGNVVSILRRAISLLSWRRVWGLALTALGLLGQVIHWGWLSLDVLGRLDVLWRVVETIGGTPALIASIISSWQFSLALIIIGLAYTVFVGEPKAGVQRHPSLPYIAAIVFFVCLTTMATVAICGEHLVEVRKAYAAGAAGILPGNSPANPQTGSNQRPLYAGASRVLTPGQQRILISEGSKIYSLLGTNLITYFSTDGETANYAQILHSTLARAAIKVGISSQALGDSSYEGNLIEVADKKSPPAEAIKLQQLLLIADIQTSFVNNIAFDPKGTPVVLFIGPRPIQR
jgi:hypothetical protein